MSYFYRHRAIMAAIMAVFQLAVMDGAVAHEWLEASAGKPPGAHVETLGGSAGCTPAHADDCVVCQQLTQFGRGLTSPLTQLPTFTKQQYSAPACDTALPRHVWHNTKSLPRAPPSSLSA